MLHRNKLVMRKHSFSVNEIDTMFIFKFLYVISDDEDFSFFHK